MALASHLLSKSERLMVGSSIAWHYENLAWTFGVLFATALADLALFAFVGNALMFAIADAGA